ncbi:hypothetical protein FV217_09350 [Methylobacterium sp. WL9]|nr:hypothetical protein FV217_09350 [Methylobacterium sp. WL9]
MRMTMSVLALCAVFGLTGAALAQSTGAPAGRDPATSPGGTEGIAGPRNEERSMEDGDAIPAPPGIGEPVPPRSETMPRQRTQTPPRP